MKKQFRRFLYLANERIEEIQIDVESALNEVDIKDRETRDKLIWAKAKINDLSRLLNSIK